MRNRASQLDVAHALTTHFGKRDFNTTFFTNNATVLHALVFATQTLVVLNRTKYLGAEQTFTLRLEGTVVNGFRLFNFAVRPGANHFRGCKADADRIKLFNLSLGLE